MLTILLSSCSNNVNLENEKNTPEINGVRLGEKELYEIVFNSQPDNSLDENLFGSWLIKSGNGSWSFYPDGTHLVHGYMESVGIWLTSGTWKNKDGKIKLLQNSYDKQKSVLEQTESEYIYSISDDVLTIKNLDGSILLELVKYSWSLKLSE